MAKNPDPLARAIDHALLRPNLTGAQVLQGLELAAGYCVASVCVRPADVPVAARHLQGSDVAVGTVIGFPHGANAPEIKALEVRNAIERGATEVDVVVNIGKVLSGEMEYVQSELGRIVVAAMEGDAVIKIILETAYLNDDQKRALCKIAVDLGADYVKTSTGFGPGGATLEDVALMRKAVAGKVRIKAAGGIADRQTAMAFLEAGCQRIGTSSTAAILSGTNS